jgi:hypothetical protein
MRELTLEANNELRELTNSEIDAVAGGTSDIGSTAQRIGGQVLGTGINAFVGIYGGEFIAQEVLVRAAQTQV